MVAISLALILPEDSRALPPEVPRESVIVAEEETVLGRVRVAYRTPTVKVKETKNKKKRP